MKGEKGDEVELSSRFSIAETPLEARQDDRIGVLDQVTKNVAPPRNSIEPTTAEGVFRVLGASGPV